MIRRILILVIAVLSSVVVDAGSCHAADGTAWTGTKLAAPGVAKHDWFGSAMSAGGEFAIAGAPYHDKGGSNAGAAWIFARQDKGWQSQSQLIAADAAPGDQFGQSVCIHGEQAIVGAPFADPKGIDSGAAYVFQRDGVDWKPVAKLTASDGRKYSEFGCSVAICGGRAMVGAQVHHDKDDEGNEVSGQVYFFERMPQGWTEVGKFADFNRTRGGALGHSMAISDKYAFAGGDTIDGVGAVYVFERADNGWKQTELLKASNPRALETFAGSLSISGDNLLVGAKFDGERGVNSGSAYIFHRDGTVWKQAAKLTAPDAQVGDLFGCSVSLSGDLAAVGAMYKNAAGAVYLFKRNGSEWKQTGKLTAPGAVAEDDFGCAVSIGGDAILVGANHSNSAGRNSGSAYVFKP